MSQLRTSELVAGYAAENVIDGLSLELPSKSVVAILGANGAGKSTLLKVLSGLIRARGGAVHLDSTDVTRFKVEQRARAGLVLVPEGRRLFNGLTVTDNLRVGRLTGRQGMTEEDVFDLFPRLAERRASLAGQLSGGEQQMLAIGRALCGGPAVLLVDEPSLGLAPKIVESLFQTFTQLAAHGITVCIGEQNVLAAVQVADRCLVLDRGRVVFESSTEDAGAREAVVAAYSRAVSLDSDAAQVAPPAGRA